MKTKILAIVATAISGSVLLTGCNSLNRVADTPAPEAMTLAIHPSVSPGNDMSHRIDESKKRVWMEMYSLNDEKVVESLIKAKQRGVDVRVMLNGGYGKSESTKKSYATLRTNKVPVKWSPSGYIFHIKTTLVDDSAVISSANLNTKNYDDHRDFSVIDTKSSHLDAIAKTFNNDWQLKAVPRKNTIKAEGLVWSPDAQDDFVKFINDSKKSIDFSSEELKGVPVAQALADASRRGVTCRVHIPDEFGSDNISAEANSIIKSSKCTMKKISPAENGIYMHAKQIISDESKVLVGSQNDSMSSLTKNRELSVIVDDKSIVDQFVKTYAEDDGSKY